MLTSRLQSVFKWIFLISLAITSYTYFQKDRFPEIDFYDATQLNNPQQTSTHKQPFETRVNDQTYTVNPLFDY